MTTLYLHIGTHKTGSTATQNYLYQHRDELISRGILYPSAGLEGTAHHRLCWACGQGDHTADPGLVISACQSIAAEAEQAEADVILSSEEFEYLQDLEHLEVLQEYFDVKVVLYVRKQDHYLESKYNQQVRSYRTRYSGSIYQFLTTFNFYVQFNYNLVAQRWENVFGQENLIVRPYGTSLVHEDGPEDLLSVAGALPITEKQGRPVIIDGNFSMSAQAIPYLSHINQVSLSHQQHHNLIALLQKRVPRDGAASLLRREDASDFYDKFGPSNTKFFSRYLGMESNPFDELLPADAEKVWVDHEKVDIRQLLGMLDHVL
tara:strand:- start:51050 stop:52003 length:954 start_codon:yes stop_codon:yes gene_type:complete